MNNGSPPQVRGKRRPEQDFTNFVGITPAGAGKTSFAAASPSVTTDHPRRCGENENADLSGLVGTGSPPQVRGKRSSRVRFAAVKPDHPRRCGENTIFFVHMRQRVGSPPQVRGKPQLSSTSCSMSRITPAGAGKTVGEF